MNSNTRSSQQGFTECSIYYGLNAENKNMILHVCTTDMKPNSYIFGMHGEGKSFSAKRET